jgi:hypothetical protein
VNGLSDAEEVLDAVEAGGARERELVAGGGGEFTVRWR